MNLMQVVRELEDTIALNEKRIAELEGSLRVIFDLASILRDYEGVFSQAAKNRIDRIYALAKPKENKNATNHR